MWDVHSRQDLGALLHRLLGVVVDRESPLLHAHSIQMWDYVVLSRLEYGPAPTQNQLASAVGRDKTRLIPILDRLQARELIDRSPDPTDRRNRIVALTDSGVTLLRECRSDIRAMEAELLAVLDPTDAATFVKALASITQSVDGDAR